MSWSSGSGSRDDLERPRAAHQLLDLVQQIEEPRIDGADLAAVVVAQEAVQ